MSDTTDSAECQRYQIRTSNNPILPSSTNPNEDVANPILTSSTNPNEDVTNPILPSSTNPNEDVAIEVGQWAVVDYDGEQYPGEVTAVSHTDEVEVSVLHKSGSGWKWPQPKDSLYYCKNNIIRIITPPIAAGHRGQFIFSDF